MSNVKTESGLQFLARIKNPESNIRNLEDTLFIDKLNENDVVELTADNVYLKNQLMMHLLKQATLVDSFEGISFGALDSGVLFIDIAFQFNVLHFSQYLQRCVDIAGEPSWSSDDKEAIVKKSLENLIYVPCYDSQQLLATFYNLRFTLSSNPKIRLVVLDNVGANYWQDTLNGGLRRMDMYEKKLISTLRNCLRYDKLPILYIRPDFFTAKLPSGNEMSNYRINVRKNDHAKVYRVFVKTKTRQIEKSFIISDSILKWT